MRLFRLGVIALWLLTLVISGWLYVVSRQSAPSQPFAADPTAGVIRLR